MILTVLKTGQFTKNSLTAFFFLLKCTHNNNGLFSVDSPLCPGGDSLIKTALISCPFTLKTKPLNSSHQEKGANAGFHSFHCYRTELRHSISVYFCHSPLLRLSNIIFIQYRTDNSNLPMLLLYPNPHLLQLTYSRAHLPMLHIFFCLQSFITFQCTLYIIYLFAM